MKRKTTTDEYFVAISKGNQVIATEYTKSLIEAKEWGEEHGESDYTITIYKNADDEPLFKYSKGDLFK